MYSNLHASLIRSPSMTARRFARRGLPLPSPSRRLLLHPGFQIRRARRNNPVMTFTPSPPPPSPPPPRAARRTTPAPRRPRPTARALAAEHVDSDRVRPRPRKRRRRRPTDEAIVHSAYVRSVRAAAGFDTSDRNVAAAPSIGARGNRRRREREIGGAENITADLTASQASDWATTANEHTASRATSAAATTATKTRPIPPPEAGRSRPLRRVTQRATRARNEADDPAAAEVSDASRDAVGAMSTERGRRERRAASFHPR